MMAIAVVGAYLAGVVAVAVGIGAWLRPGRGRYLDVLDYVTATGLAVLWPVLLLFAALVLPILLAMALLYYAVKGLMCAGGFLAERMDGWLERKARSKGGKS